MVTVTVAELRELLDTLDDGLHVMAEVEQPSGVEYAERSDGWVRPVEAVEVQGRFLVVRPAVAGTQHESLCDISRMPE